MQASVISSAKRKQEESTSENEALPSGSSGGKRRKRPFWKNGIIYQIYPRSFYDSNGDGIGDLQGIIAKVDYLSELGVEMIWLNPVLKSPMKDFGYDISNFKEIDPIFGTMKDFELLLQKMHSKDLKVIFDFVPNHTSDQHEWFRKSVERDPQYDDYYVWKEPLGFYQNGDPIPPNNWLSVFRYSAWEWCEERQQFYLHQFLKEQPDLNYRNPDVVTEMNNVIRFWLDKGVDGFRLDAIKHLFEIEDVYGADEPVSEHSEVSDPTQYDYVSHIYTVNQPETFEIIRGWRKILDEYSDKVMLAEVIDDDIDEIMKYYGTEDEPLADFPFNFYLITNLHTRNYVTGFSLKANVDLWLRNLPPGKWPNWVIGNHDLGRVASRLGPDIIDALNMFILLLPGTPITYYGEEIGMEDSLISYENTQDPWGRNMGQEHYAETSRDPARTPMQWDNSKNAGFTSKTRPWIPVNENYQMVNVVKQKESLQSHLKVYKELSQLRKSKTFQQGDIEFQSVTEEIVAYIRYLEAELRYLIVINTSPNETVVNVQDGKLHLPEFGTVVLRSSSDYRMETSIGSTVDLRELPLLGGEGLVLQIED